MATCIMAVGATGRDLFEFDGQPLHFFNAWVSSKQGMKPTNVNDTVDGRNPAPSGMAENHSFDKPPFLLVIRISQPSTVSWILFIRTCDQLRWGLVWVSLDGFSGLITASNMDGPW